MLKVKETFFVGNTCYRAGFDVSETDPVVKGRELLFVAGGGRSVEQASASPGSTRSVKRPATKTAKTTKTASVPTKPATARK